VLILGAVSISVDSSAVCARLRGWLAVSLSVTLFLRSGPILGQLTGICGALQVIVGYPPRHIEDWATEHAKKRTTGFGISR
jgi:hypothetical protein